LIKDKTKKKGDDPGSLPVQVDRFVICPICGRKNSDGLEVRKNSAVVMINCCEKCHRAAGAIQGGWW